MATTTRILDANVNGTVYTANANDALEALDTCHSGAVAPTDEVANGKLWLDTSTTPAILKMYNNAGWEVIGGSTSRPKLGGIILDGNSFTNNVITGTNPTLTFSDTGTDDDWRIRNAGGAFIFENGVDVSPTTDRMRIDLNGDVSFYDDTGVTKFTWDSSTASLGINTTTTPASTLDVNGTATSTGLGVNGNATVSGLTTFGTPPDSLPSNNASGSGATMSSSGKLSMLGDSDWSLGIGRHTTEGQVAFFYYGGSIVGNISVTASSTAYNTSSDYRLKENITPVQGAADIVKAMQPVTYTFKSDGSWHDGFLAHELQELHPRAVTGEKDAMRDEDYEVTPAVIGEGGAVVTEAVMGTRSVPDYQGVDYSKITPILTAALQEALTKIDALEARVTALEP